jgi:hypothetical protein
LTLRTATARQQATSLAEALRQELIPAMQGANALLEAQQDGQTVDDYSLRQYAGIARALRMGTLLQSETERTLVRRLEIEFGKREAKSKEEIGDWDAAVQIWGDLVIHYPGVLDSFYRNARVQQARHAAQQQLSKGQPQEAFLIIESALQDSSLRQAWELHLVLAEIRAELGDFDLALNALEGAKRYARDNDLIWQKEIEIKVIQAKKTRSVEEALRILQENLDKRSNENLEQLRTRLFEDAARELLNKADEGKQKGTDEGQIQAVVALVDLKRLEEIIRIPEENRRSTEELVPLRARLAGVAKSVKTEASIFNPATHPLDQALAEAGKLSSRLQTFGDVARLFGAELGGLQNELKTQLDRLSGIHDRLSRLKEMVTQGGNPEMWKRAVDKGNFEELERISAQMKALTLDEMLEVKQFNTHLAEWKIAHEFLLKKIAEIKALFSKSEDFARAARELRSLRTMPDVQPANPGNGLPWRYFLPADYEVLRQRLDPRLRITDLFSDDGDDIIGWDDVENACEIRAQERQVWETWKLTYSDQMDLAQDALKITSLHDDSTTVVQKKADWENAQKLISAALQTLETPPELNDEPAGIHSNFAEDVQKEGEIAKQFIRRNWLMTAEMKLTELARVRAFPTTTELAGAAQRRNWEELKRLLDIATSIGTFDPKQQKEIDHFTKVLENGRKKDRDDKGGLFRRQR